MNNFLNRDGGNCVMIFPFNSLCSDSLLHDRFGGNSFNRWLSESDVDSLSDYLRVDMFLSNQQVTLDVNFLVSNSVLDNCRFGNWSMVDNPVRWSLDLNVDEFSILDRLNDLPCEVLVSRCWNDSSVNRDSSLGWSSLSWVSLNNRFASNDFQLFILNQN